MQPGSIGLVLGLLLIPPRWARSQTAHDPIAPITAPLYRISFQRGDPIAGVVSAHAFQMPYACTSDGTVFVNLVFPGTSNSLPAPPSPHFAKYAMPAELVSISLSGEAHTYRLDQLTDLYDLQQLSYYASDSKVVFLVRAAGEDKQATRTVVTPDGATHEVTRNIAEHHIYAVIFDRTGTYKKTVQMDDSFDLRQLGIFPSGHFLVLGMGRDDHSPKLAVLNEDGTLLKLLEVAKNDLPESMLRTKDGKGPAVYLRPSQLVPQGNSITLVLNETDLPLLEVNEAGAILAITPRLPLGDQVKMLIASDQNLYVRSDGPKGSSTIDELNPQDGTLLRRIESGRNEVFCVHDGKFLGFDFGGNDVVPLIGTPEPEALIQAAQEPKP
jgi:hypothetical protein